MNITKETPIAVIGVSSDPEKYGHKIFKDLLAHEYTVIGVNPKGETILGETIYSSIEKIPQKPELVMLVVPPKIGIGVVKEAAALGITQFWCQPGAESDEIITYCKENNLELVHDSCFMVQKNIW